MEEQWKSIINYPNYEISNLGNCRNIKTNKNLKYTMMTGGYKKYGLYNYDENGKRTEKSLSIHRLIATHFIPNPENKLQVDHIDNDRLNNSIDNLRWATNGENGRNKTKKINTTSKYFGVSYNKHRNKWDCVIQINRKQYHKQFDTEHEAAVKRDEFILDNDLKYFKLNFIHI